MARPRDKRPGLLEQRVIDARTAAEAALDPVERLHCLADLAEAQWRAGLVTEATTTVKEALEKLPEKQQRSRLALRLHLAHADCLGRMGMVEESRAAMEHAEPLLKDGIGDQKLRAYTFVVRGHQNMYEGSWHDAIPEYEKALSLYRGIGDASGVTYVTMMLANAYHHLGQFARATAHFHRTLKEAVTSGDMLIQAMAYTNLAALDNETFQPKQAYERLSRALELAKQLGEVRGQAIITEYMGHALVQMGQHLEALQYYDESLLLIVGRDEMWIEAFIHGGRAQALLGLGKVHDAAKAIEHCLALTERVSSFDSDVWAWRNAALVADAQGDWALANERFAKADGIASERGQPLRHLDVLRQWSAACKARGEHDRAEEHSTKAIGIAESLGLPQVVQQLHKELQADGTTAQEETS